MMRMVGMNMEWGCSLEGEGGRQIKMMTCGHHRVKRQYVYIYIYVCVCVCVIHVTQVSRELTCPKSTNTVFF